MRGMHRFFMIALAVGVMALFAAGTALADAKIVGYVAAGLGQLSTEPPAPAQSQSDIEGLSEAQIDVSGGVGAVTARYRLRVRDNTGPNAVGGGFAAVRHDVNWSVTDAFQVQFWGQSFGLPALLNAYGAYSIGHFTHGAPIGDTIVHDGAFFVNRTGVNLQFATGGIRVGVVILEDNGGIDGAFDKSGPDTIVAGVYTGESVEDSSFTPWFMGTFGAITVSLAATSASGKDPATGLDQEASQNVLTARYRAGGMDLAFEYSTNENNAKAEKTGMGLGGKIGPLGFHYVTQETESAAGTVTAELTEISLSYTMKLTDQGELAFMFATQDTGVAPAETSQQFVGISGKSSF